MPSHDITSVSVNCTDQPFTLGGTVSGLSAAGLVLASGSTTLSIPANASNFTLPSPVSYGSAYSVTVRSSPAGLMCSVTSGSGTMPAMNVTTVVVTCADHSYPVGGSVTGLNATGLVLANGSDLLSVATGATIFTMPTAVAYSSSYSVTIHTQPTGLTCTVANGTGTMGAGPVTNISVTCAENSYTIGGTLSGLGSATGLMLANGPDTLAVNANATTFTMPTGIASGASYHLVVATQPTGETCTVAGGSGTVGSANVLNIVVTCSDQAYSLGGTIQGLNGTGLVLANGSDSLNVSAGATSFTMPAAIAYTSSYSVTVQTQPTGSICAVSAGSGVMPAHNVATVAVTCTDQPFTLGGTVSGLGANTGLVLENAGQTYAVPASATSFVLPTPVNFGSPYAVSVQSSPAGLTCTSSNSTGTMPAGNVTNIAVTCANQAYTIGGSVSGLSTAGLVLANGSDTLSVAANASSFTMPTPVAYTSPYSVVVQTQPAATICTVVGGSGTMGSANVTSIAINCAPSVFTIGGSIGGLGSASGLTLANGSDTLAVLANATTFTMPTGVATGSPYDVTVQAHPILDACSVANGTGTVAGADVTNVAVACTAGTESVLYSFGVNGNDAAVPYYSHLLLASDGNFYGLSYDGGTSHSGTVFRITPAGAETVLWSFGLGSDGQRPYGSLVQGNDGNFYGTTYSGGANGGGTVFKITPTGNETVLYSFGSGTDGANPRGSLVLGSDGNFYGMTYAGGANGGGTVFNITPNGTETVLWSFGSNSDGYFPYGSLVQGTDGNFYGMTYAGGANGGGTVFKITPSGTETVLWSFGGGNDGYVPYGSLVQGTDGNFYGTTQQGGATGAGIVFNITPSGTETILWSFGGGSDGGSPTGSLLLGSDGNFYGMTQSGGASGAGTIFQITPSGTETLLWSFGSGSDGSQPYGDLTLGPDGTLYGETSSGGTNGKGAVIEFN
jgi:uncharacterized repeat protein (TIGR03803 family)